MITPITATFPSLNFPKEVDYPTQEDWAAFSAAAELNYGILSGTWSEKSEEFKAQTNTLALEIQEIGENAINAITFDNIAQLKLNSNIGRVDVLGYYTKGDGGGGTFYWDSTSIESDNGGTIIQATGITTGRWKRVYSGAVNVKWFGAVGDGVTDDTVAIQNALNISLNVFIPGGIYKTTSPLEIPVLTSFYGEGNGTVIKPTYSSWVGTDYRAIVLETKEGVNYHNRDFGKKISNFSIEGVDSHLVQSIALDFRTKNPNSVTDSTVNWSLYSTFISNICISRFDTALNILELWAASFNSILIFECREAIHIEGQAVNNMFSHIQATNFTNGYTSSIENTFGISVDSSNRYNGIDHRPEGFCFDSCLIFGAYNNLIAVSCLTFKMSKMILDGGVNTCIVLVDPSDFIISESYIYTNHTEYISFEGLAVQQTDSVRIINNNFMGKTLSDVGINFKDAGVSRTNITISGNSFYNFGTSIHANKCPNDSIISNNTATGNLSYSLANSFITVISGGARTYIDGNRTRENMSIIFTHPANTSPLLEIGNNSSLNQTTRKTGKVILPAGSTTVAVPVWTTTDQYVRFIVSVSCDQLTDFKYSPNTNFMNGTITIPSALGVNAVFSYTTTTIPYTASV